MEHWNDGIIKSRHSRENGNPGDSDRIKILDSCLCRNDKNLFLRLFEIPSRMEFNLFTDFPIFLLFHCFNLEEGDGYGEII